MKNSTHSSTELHSPKRKNVEQQSSLPRIDESLQIGQDNQQLKATSKFEHPRVLQHNQSLQQVPQNSPDRKISSPTRKGNTYFSCQELRDLEILNKLGEGAFSTVYKVRRLKDKKEYALKRIKIGELTEKEKENALNEIRFLASIKSKYIISFRQAVYDSSLGQLCVLMDYAQGGDLQQFMKKYSKASKSIQENTIWSFTQQIAKGLKVLHDLKILHRDLKAANIFLDKTKTEVLLGDLNVSKKLRPDGFLYTQTGTPYYASPEVWNDIPYNTKSDIWSFGCILYELCTFQPPFKAQDMQKLAKKIQKGVYDQIPPQYSQELKDLISQMLKVDAQQRPNCDQILDKIESYGKADFLQNQQEQFQDENQLLSTIKVGQAMQGINDKLPAPRYQDMWQTNESQLNERRVNILNRLHSVSICYNIDQNRIVSSNPICNDINNNNNMSYQEIAHVDHSQNKNIHSTKQLHQKQIQELLLRQQSLEEQRNLKKQQKNQGINHRISSEECSRNKDEYNYNLNNNSVVTNRIQTTAAEDSGSCNSRIREQQNQQFRKKYLVNKQQVLQQLSPQLQSYLINYNSSNIKQVQQSQQQNKQQSQNQSPRSPQRSIDPPKRQIHFSDEYIKRSSSNNRCQSVDQININKSINNSQHQYLRQQSKNDSECNSISVNLEDIKNQIKQSSINYSHDQNSIHSRVNHIDKEIRKKDPRNKSMHFQSARGGEASDLNPPAIQLPLRSYSHHKQLLDTPLQSIDERSIINNSSININNNKQRKATIAQLNKIVSSKEYNGVLPKIFTNKMKPRISSVKYTTNNNSNNGNPDNNYLFTKKRTESTNDCSTIQPSHQNYEDN